MRAVVLLATLAGCQLVPDRGDKPVIPPVRTWLESPDQALPAAVVGQAYTAGVAVSGGEPPYTWTVVDKAGLPVGLTLSEEGVISGVPAQAGDFVFALQAKDAVGRTKRTLVSLQVVLDPLVARCGETLTGAFPGSAMGPSGPDLADLENLAWLAVELPDDGTTRIDLVFRNQATTTLYVERPAELAGSWNLEDHYVGYAIGAGGAQTTVSIDAGTNPSLTGFATQVTMPMVLVAQTAGAWEVEVVCTDGPVFERLLQYPTELGTELQLDYDVFGDNTGVRIFPREDEVLPDWMLWDPATGTVTGTAAEPGAWEFWIVAEDEEGRRREERTVIGVYEIVDLACDETVPVSVEEGYFDGEFYAYYDPKGFRVFRVPLDDAPDVSAVDLVVTGSDGHYLGLADVAPDWLKFYGGAERRYESTLETRLTLDAASYPAARHYLDEGELYASVGTIGVVRDFWFSVACDRSPRPDFAALPVVLPLTPVSTPLPARGGSVPYTWSARGLPAGLSLTPDGVLTGTTGASGTHEVELTVVDKLGGASTGTWPLHVGAEAACAGYVPIDCGDSIDGVFETTYFSDNSGPRSTAVFCAVEDGRSLGFEIYADDADLRVDVADPGASATEMFGEARGTYVQYVPRESSTGVGIDPWSWPDLDDYRGLPVLVAVRAFDPGGWTVHLACE